MMGVRLQGGRERARRACCNMERCQEGEMAKKDRDKMWGYIRRGGKKKEEIYL